MEINKELLEKVRNFAYENEKTKRYEHSLRVAEFAGIMCRRYGIDWEKGYFAGLAHDICKELDENSMILLAEKDGKPFTFTEKEKPSLLHGRAAAVVLRQKFNVQDEQVLQAVSCHTLGEKNMCELAKIVYVSDKVEPGRPQSTAEYRQSLLEKNLDDALIEVLRENMKYLREKGRKIAPESFDFYQGLLNASEVKE
ncbi:MAG: bis(5'-nucleosyl)-tetraphosphatase (symmetrical) YqeK [Spirochaetia bacterium]|nr:bis(5'-nucleosyl)-tetraphosphatase (symmetrical) YqeK [Spirochaetia bacterium]